jgi:hypothetical protein
MSTRLHRVHGVIQGRPVESVTVTATDGATRSYLVHGNSHLTIADAERLLRALTAALAEVRGETKETP